MLKPRGATFKFTLTHLISGQVSVRIETSCWASSGHHHTSCVGCSPTMASFVHSMPARSAQTFPCLRGCLPHNVESLDLQQLKTLT